MTFRITAVMLLSALAGMGAVPNRITRPVDARRTVPVNGNIHRLAQAQFDRGTVDPGMSMDYMVLLTKPSPAQQTDLDQLLADQQNPSSPLFRNWLTPEAFANRFGLSAGDQSKVVAWLSSAGFTVNHLARGRNWIAFSGNAAQVSAALHTPIHRFQVAGEMHFSNTSEPAVPEALSDVVSGFLGLNDFRPNSFVRPVEPDNNTGTAHYLVPGDFATIYDLNPLYQAGVDGTGQSIAVVGQSDVSLSDLRSFRTRYGLPQNDPKMLPYSTTDPGFTSSQVEGDLDLEWAGAIAPKATIYYVYGPSAITAVVAAVEINVAPVISISYGNCEIDFAPAAYRSIAQQANAQGITILAASGDSGAAGCDSQGAEPFALRGLAATFPSAIPEVTGVGGTQFVEGSGTYWGSTNATNFNSALGYIPEAVWNESAAVGLLSGGGGASLLYPRPAWQSGPGVPNDTARHVPDVAFSAALHDGYYIYYNGANGVVGGTSASAPSMAGIVALLNQYQIANGIQKTPGLGNINPQLYRLAQSQPSVFHDITAGNNIVLCEQGTPDCATGSFGYPAGLGYDMGAGLGSIDANLLATTWNTAASGVLVTLSASPATATLNDTVQLTATVAPAKGGGTPTGSVNFVLDTIALGTVPLTNGSASFTFPLYLVAGTGTFPVAAQYSGDASFSSGGATRAVRITLPTGAAAVVPSAPNTVWPQPPDAQGLIWQTAIGLFELAGVPAMVTGFTIDGQPQSLSTYFPSPNISPNSSVSVPLVFRGLAAPVTRTFGFTGIDALGNSWARTVSVNFLPLPTDNFFGLSATPLTVQQNTAADPSCQWAVQLNVDDLGGFGFNLISGILAGRVSLTSRQIASTFGTTRLDAWNDVHGTLCFSGITPPASDLIDVVLSDGASFNLVVSFAGPSPAPVSLSASPSSISVAAASAKQPAQTTLAVNLPAPTQTWTASVYPANRTTSWLSLSQLSGTGSSQLTLTANGTGFEPGVYRATIVIQSANSVPQYINVPVMFVLGGSTLGTTISSVANPASDYSTVSPGMLLNVLGSNLASATQTSSGNPLPFSTGGVTATVNGLPAPVVSISPAMLTIQVPYEVSAGPAVLGINNNGQIAGFAIQIAPSSPGVFSDATGNLVPSGTVAQGSLTTLFVTGTGEVSPALRTGFTPPAISVSSPASTLPKPVLPLSVTVGGVPAFVQFAGVPPGLVGTTQVNLIVPPSVPLGSQPVVVTVGGVSSPAVNVLVTAAH